MARNGSGTMSVPNTFSSGTTISSSAMNANFSDIGSEITNSLPRDGQASMTGQFKASSGTAAAPGIAFSSDTNTGFYSKSGDTIGIVAGGTEVGTIGTSGLTDANSNAIVGMPTGAMMMYGATTAPTGWTRCNGRTIGNASSSATERANADTSALFTFLWTNYSDSVCAVSTGRGASAAADYAANKTIALPDLRGRAFFGLDDMGGTAASRLGTVITSSTTNGASGGAETVALSETHVPSHTHSAGSLTAASGGAHTHSLTLRFTSLGAGATVAGYHADAINGSDVRTTSSDGAHTHTVSGTTGTSSGSGTAHPSMPPAFLTTFIIKL